MEVPEEIVYNAIIDFNKKGIDPFTKAKIIQAYMKNKGLSQRRAAEELNMCRGSIQRFLRFLRLDQSEYEEKVRQGKSKEEILAEVKQEGDYGTIEITTLDIALDKLLNQLRKGINYTPRTLDRAQRLKRELEKLIAQIEATK